MRIARLLAPLAIVASAAFPQARSSAVQTLAFTFPVLCSDEAGFPSNGLADITLPSGNYVVATAGVCGIIGGAYGYSVGTPCNDPVLGTPIPCAGGWVANLPEGICHITTGGVRTECTPAPTPTLPGCGFYSVQINGNCVNGQVATYYHGGGPMRVRLYDSAGNYGDNIGALLVTVTWTPL